MDTVFVNLVEPENMIENLLTKTLFTYFFIYLYSNH